MMVVVIYILVETERKEKKEGKGKESRGVRVPVLGQFRLWFSISSDLVAFHMVLVLKHVLRTNSEPKSELAQNQAL